MFRCRMPSFSTRRHRRVISGVTLAVYLLAVVGFPLPMPSIASRDTSTPFPCQNHHCGCHTAEQCWRSCCCFSAAERLAWAAAHGVTLTADVRAAMHDESHEPHAACEHKGCCEGAADDHESDGHHCGKCRDSEQAPKARWISGFQAQKCHGLTLLWIALGATLPVEIVSLWDYDWAQIGMVCAVDGEFSPLFFEPAVPPPRV
jgi:hypothetical protein